MPSRVELVAYNRDDTSIAQAIGADLVIFQTLHDLISAVRQFNPEIETFDCSVFTGEYVTGGVDAAYLNHLEKIRSDNAKNKAHLGELGSLEGKGGGAVRTNGANDAHSNGVRESKELSLGCSGPMNGADDTVGLHNTWKIGRAHV